MVSSHFSLDSFISSQQNRFPDLKTKIIKYKIQFKFPANFFSSTVVVLCVDRILLTFSAISSQDRLCNDGS